MKKIVKSFRLSKEMISKMETRNKEKYPSESDYLEAALEQFTETDGKELPELLADVSQQLKEVNGKFLAIEGICSEPKREKEWAETIAQDSILDDGTL